MPTTVVPAPDAAPTHPDELAVFGDSARIQARNIARFRLGVAMLAAHECEPGKIVNQTVSLGDADLLPLFFDPVLRNAFEDELTRLDRRVRLTFGIPQAAADQLLPGLRTLEKSILSALSYEERASAGPAGQDSHPRRRSRHRPARAPRRPAHPPRPARRRPAPFLVGHERRTP